MDGKTENAALNDAVKCPCCSAEHDSLFLCNAGKDRHYPQYRCRRCGFQFSRPCPTPEEIDRFYASGEYYARTGDGKGDDAGNYENYDEQTGAILSSFRDMLKAAALPEKSSLLDVGCALGRFMELAWKEFGFECSGVELSDYAREYVKKHYGGRFPVWKSPDEMPVPEKKFDLILLFDVIEHVNDPWSLLLGLFRRGCIDEHTRVLITTPNCASGKASKDPENWQYRYPPAHLSFCAPETFQKIGETLLFRNIDISGRYLQEERPSVGEMLRDTYFAYDGLICSFSGSSLGRIAPENFPATLAELKRSREYLALLSEYAFDRRNEPFNPQFRTYLAELYDKLSSQNSRLASEIEGARSRAGELASQNSRLISEVERGSRNSYSMWLRLLESFSQSEQLLSQNGELKAQAGELAGCRDQLEKQVRELTGERDRLNARVCELASYRDHLENQVRELAGERDRQAAQLRELADYKDHLENQVRELAGCKGVLENQVRELTAQRDRLDAQSREFSKYIYHLEIQVRELAGEKDRLAAQLRELADYRDHLEKQVRELAGERDELAARVRELSAKFDEVRLSRSYRIGRAVTWPFRQCKAAAVFIFGKLNRHRK